MTDRLILPMLDVCVTCLREQVVADEDTIDGAMIFATGFAPFRGGPMYYARTRGAASVQQKLEQLAAKYGERFRPDAGWNQLA
jgi:3-hydroxyacyl-CoA dehydrogenase/enoyl-CoA hydratase/3-hydroxybutyryl-CoA epimerase